MQIGIFTVGDVTTDPTTGRTPTELERIRATVEIAKKAEDIGLDVSRRAYERYDSVADDFGSVRGESAWTMSFARDEWNVRTETRTVLRSDEREFVLDATLALA